MSESKRNKRVNRQNTINNNTKKVKSKHKQGDNKNKKNNNDINCLCLNYSNIKRLSPEENIEKYINIKFDKINPLLHLKFPTNEYNKKNYVEDIDLKQYKFSKKNKDYYKVRLNNYKEVKLFGKHINIWESFKIKKTYNFDDYLKSKDINVLNGFLNINEGDVLDYIQPDLNNRINFELRKRKFNSTWK